MNLIEHPAPIDYPMFDATGADQHSVNDIHSGLNATRVAWIVTPSNVQEVQATVCEAARIGAQVAICGSRHAMGGQQFAEGALLLDMRAMTRVLGYDAVNGLLQIEAGIEWPAVIDYLEHAGGVWSIRQKQTGADNLSIGGCLAANVHGRGLNQRPFIADVENFTLVDADGTLRHCSRVDNHELFRTAIGGYGLFGVITSVTLRLAPRQKMRRDVRLLTLDELMPAFRQRLADGYAFGDFQFAIDPHSTDFLQRGVFSCYCPVPDNAIVNGSDKELSEQDWRDLLLLAHVDKSRAFESYAAHYLASDGQVYYSDRLQQATYLDGYHQELDARLGHTGSEMIGEVYVPRWRLVDFMREVAQDFRTHGVDLIYGTVRQIEADSESFLPWARQPYACIIFNLHTQHTAAGVNHTASAFQRLIELAQKRDGSFYLTYGKFASRAQIETSYPQFAEFLQRKLQYDPQQRFQSNWYRHYRDLFAQAETSDAARVGAGQLWAHAA
jgi:FAD/FMN-containing dehydrogenase